MVDNMGDDLVDKMEEDLLDNGMDFMVDEMENNMVDNGARQIIVLSDTD